MTLDEAMAEADAQFGRERVAKMQIAGADPRGGPGRVVEHGAPPHAAAGPHNVNRLAGDHEGMMQAPGGASTEDHVRHDELHSLLRAHAPRLTPEQKAQLRRLLADDAASAPADRLDKAIDVLRRAVAEVTEAGRLTYGVSTYQRPAGHMTGWQQTPPEGYGASGGTTRVSESRTAAAPPPRQPEQTSVGKGAGGWAAAGLSALDRDLAPPPVDPKAEALRLHEANMRRLAGDSAQGTRFVAHGQGAAVVKAARPAAGPADYAAALPAGIDLAPPVPGTRTARAAGVEKGSGVSVHDLAPSPEEDARDAAFAAVGLGGQTDLAEAVARSRRFDAFCDAVAAVQAGKGRR